jgi:hypothetical protein
MTAATRMVCRRFPRAVVATPDVQRSRATPVAAAAPHASARPRTCHVEERARVTLSLTLVRGHLRSRFHPAWRPAGRTGDRDFLPLGLLRGTVPGQPECPARRRVGHRRPPAPDRPTRRSRASGSAAVANRHPADHERLPHTCLHDLAGAIGELPSLIGGAGPNQLPRLSLACASGEAGIENLRLVEAETGGGAEREPPATPSFARSYGRLRPPETV